MSAGTWVLRTGVYTMVFGALFALNQLFPGFLQALANTIFFWQGSEVFETQRLLQLYGVFFGLGTLIIVGYEISIRNSIQESGR